MNGSNHFPLFYSSTVQEIENNVPVFSLGYKMDVIKLGHSLSVGLLISRNLDRAWQLSHCGTYLLQWRSSHGQNAMKELQSHHNLLLLDYQTFPPFFHPLTHHDTCSINCSFIAWRNFWILVPVFPRPVCLVPYSLSTVILRYFSNETWKHRK